LFQFHAGFIFDLLAQKNLWEWISAAIR